jgi:hypothetical protein
MTEITIQTKVKPATGLREMVDSMTGKRRIGLIYYQQLEDGNFIARCLTEQTDKDFLQKAITNKKIYVPILKTTVETT